MRYLTVRLVPRDQPGFHPLGERLLAEPSLQREAVHHFELLDDGTLLLLAEGSGDRDRYEEIMASEPTVRDYMVSGEERWMAVSQFEANEAIREVLAWQQREDIVVETPVQFQQDGSQQMTLIGEDESFRALYEEATSLDSFDIEVVETGEYTPDTDRLARTLTTRQQEIMAAAVDLGYYREPREATHEDIAGALDLSPSAVGKHLRRVEERVFAALAR
ncbi:helix-turn-helix domain-containing protein [Haloglomus halophilum]|uniref:helix-turn-helix domain-containing protein n=1 Tax=Haloglomus halophilum TaxID=2962672 RepID=UPI0020C973C6|nr:helix-turn-helix domain-containing protein [Haloglomus halophilum]